VALGRFDEAVEHITAARDLDPLSPRANTDIGWLYLHLRQPGEAVRACQHTLAIQPNALEAQACLERAYIELDLYDQALRAAEATLPSDAHLLVDATAEAASRVHAVWRWRLARMQQAESTGWVSRYSIAVHLAFVGDLNGAMEQLEQAYAAREGVLAFLKTDPALDRLRSHYRFDALVDKIKASAR
jgi:tetratricopeptide (TPR) repeat protein